ncbi:MAG: 30S ribosomal protein S1 [Chloroflexi bacterium]|nr:30S ribosomal protein S1 [Chloroflexota bacterium]|tara:strand:- start:2692 stop:3867 length:1176 start_codon:yes stop_codon:yes gene_type:complete
MSNQTEHDEGNTDQGIIPEERTSGQNDLSSFEEQMTSLEEAAALSTGQLVTGIFVGMQETTAVVSIGQKMDGIIPAENMQTLSQSEVQSLIIGSELASVVIRIGTNDSPTILSLDQAQYEAEWLSLQDSLTNGSTVEGTVISTNRGGCLVKLNSLQGFVPLSQMSLGSQAGGPAPTQEEDRIGQTLKLKVLEVDRTRNRIVLSERVAVNEARANQKAKLMSELSEGQLITGHVSGLTEFGAFVDLGGADGLIHISELSWDSVGKASDILQMNQEVTVSVLRVDPEKNRIALSLRRTEPEPWETIDERYEHGQLVEGTITKLADFGAFARVEHGIEGLIHISEITPRTIRHPREVLSEGDVVSLKVLSVEADRRRLGLSLKQAIEEGENASP